MLALYRHSFILLFFLSGCNTLSYISQRELEDMAGGKQSVIARMESGKTDPQLSTILKLLVSMGKTLTIVPLELSEK